MYIWSDEIVENEITLITIFCIIILNFKGLSMIKEELLKKRLAIKKKMWDIEKILKDKTFVASVDFASIK